MLKKNPSISLRQKVGDINQLRTAAAATAAAGRGMMMMRWRNVPSGHWVGSLTLMVGLCLAVAGVVSPWWRMVEEGQCSSFEGLWQQCSRCWHGRTQCRFSERRAGLWRGIQGLHLLSLVCLSGALLSSLACADKRPCTRGRCPTPALVAFIGGVAGLMASLMFVGYTERYVQHLPAQHAYAWSFALSLAGSLLSLLASLMFSMAKALCLPRYRAQSVEPYWPYNQCQVGLDPSGYPHYLPYPCVACPVPVMQTSTPAELDLALSSRAVEKRKLFEQYRHGRVQGLSEEEKKMAAVSGVSAAVTPSSSTSTLTVEARSGDTLKQALAVKAAVESRQGFVGPPPYQEIVPDVKEEASKTEHKEENYKEESYKEESYKEESYKEESYKEESSAEDDPKKAADPAQAETDQTSLPDQSGAPQPGSLAVDLTIEVPDNLPKGQSAEEGKPPVFIVEKAFQDCSGAGGTNEDTEK